MLNAFNTITNRRILPAIITLGLFFAYTVSIVSKNELYANMLSVALNATITAFIAFYAWRTQNLRSHWGLITLAIGAWSISDTIWLVCSLLGNDIKNNDLVFTQVVYFLPVVFLFLGAAAIFRQSVDVNLNAQSIVDTTTIVLIYISFVYFVVFDQNLHAIFAPKATFDIIYILIDVGLFCIVFCMYFSISNLRHHTSFWLVMLGFAFFSIYDVYNSVLAITGANLTNTVFDIFYEVGFVIFLLASFHLKSEAQPKFKERKDFNAVLIYKFVILLGLICIMMIFTGKFHILWMSFIMVLMLFFGVLTHQVSSIKNSQFLMQKEKNMRERLNSFINQRMNELTQTNKRLVELGKYDYLTRALNRPHFLVELEDMIKSKPLEYSISVFSIDLSNFKTINDSYGHNVGDGVLTQVVKNIKAVLPKGSLVARFGGDDIMIAAKQRMGTNYRDVLNRLIGAIKQPIFIGEYKITLGAAIGVAQTPTSEIVPSDLISQADAALSIAKKQGQIDIVVLYDDVKQTIQERNYIEILLNSMEFDQEFKLVFQPQYQIKDKKLIGAEALLRWHSPLKGFVSPATFIPIAEQSSIIVDIGKWVAKRAIEQMSQWNATYGTNLKIGINVSPKQIDSINFATDIILLAKEQNLEPKCLDIEITEMSWMSAEGLMQGVLKQFASSGVTVSIDDFGTGFSSLSYIKKYSINKLKIAKELIDNIALNQTDKNIVMAIIALAKRLGVRTIAEGVEDEKQLEILRELGCDEVQGYFWGKPMSKIDFEELIKSQSSALSI